VAAERDLRGGHDGLRLPPPARVLLVVLLMYLFLVGIAFLEAGIAAAGEGFQLALLREVSHPISGLCAGLLATVLVQSSSVSTSPAVPPPGLKSRGRNFSALTLTLLKKMQLLPLHQSCLQISLTVSM
jgi:hypothetical protein